MTSTEQPITIEPEGKQYLPRNYRVVPYNQRPLGMRVLERTSNQPMEELIALLWFRYRTMPKLDKALGTTTRTTRRWLRQLGLFICLGCSRKTGLLIIDGTKCNYCGGYLCPSCLEKDKPEHMVDY